MHTIGEEVITNPRDTINRVITSAPQLVESGDRVKFEEACNRLSTSSNYLEKEGEVYYRALFPDGNTARFLKEKLRNVTTTAFWHTAFGSLAHLEFKDRVQFVDEMVDCSSADLGGWSEVREHDRFLRNQLPRVGKYDEFMERYAAFGAPVIIEGLGRDWPAQDRWRKDKFLQNYGETEVSFLQSGKSLSVGSYVARFNDASYDGNYLFDLGVLISTTLNTRADYWIPEWFDEEYWSPADHVQHFYLGPKGSGVDFHSHPSAVNVLVYGVKKWYFLPPEYNWLRSYPVLRDITTLESEIVPNLPVRPIEAVQRAGETVFVPPGWVHAVVNLTPTIGVAFEMFKNLACERALGLDYSAP